MCLPTRCWSAVGATWNVGCGTSLLGEW
jgi:hypothetical protein